eukprot:UN26614
MFNILSSIILAYINSHNFAFTMTLSIFMEFTSMYVLFDRRFLVCSSSIIFIGTYGVDIPERNNCTWSKIYQN